MVSSRIEVVSGLLAGLLGAALLAFAVFGPSYGTSSTNLRTGGESLSYVSMVALGLDPRAVAFLALMAACLASVASASYLHSRLGGHAWLALLRVCAVLLVLGAFIGSASIGLLLPSGALAMVAAAAGNQSPRAGHEPPRSAR